MESIHRRRGFANPWMAVREETIRRADGSTGLFTVVEAPDIALVIPADGERMHLVEQYRHPVRARSWEFPSGSEAGHAVTLVHPPRGKADDHGGWIVDSKTIAAYALLTLHAASRET